MILYNCINRHTETSPLCLKKNQNAPRPSEHPPVRGGEMSKRSVRWDLQRLQIMHTVFNRVRYGTVQWPVLVVIIGAIEPYHNTI